MTVDIFGHTDVGSTQRIVSGGITLSQAVDTFLKRDGTNTATGDINLDSHKLVNLSNPSRPQDAATKRYVENSNSKRVSKTGDSMTGNLLMGSNKIGELADPTEAQDAATKNYVDNVKGFDVYTGTATITGIQSGVTGKIGGAHV